TEHFNGFPRSTRRGILEWIHSAKRPDTRLRRIRETARLAQENIRANQYRR
ncbi:MAG: YdeI/OmpD-associated family protein, partial [Bacteroidota bacterium]